MHAPLWVFGYGSLMWNPEFPFAERRPARLEGYHRSFCMRSIHHRGTVETPGLVLALDETPGAVCDGVAYRVEPEQSRLVLAALRERELISSAYVEMHLEVALDHGEEVRALAYVIEKSHPQYEGELSLEEQARRIAAAVGGRGPNPDYLFATTAHLDELGISDPDLAWLEARVRSLTQG